MTRRHNRRAALARLGSAVILTVGSGIFLGCATSVPPSSQQDQALPPALESSISDRDAPQFIRAFELLGEAALPASAGLEEPPVGGLSSIAYDAERDLYYAISDDPASRGPARFYTLSIDLGGGSLNSTQVEVLELTELLDRDGKPFAEMTLDLEGIALTPERTLYVSSEGQVKQGIEPFLREYRLDGTYIRDLAIPKKFIPRAGEKSGIRHNLGFESVALDSHRNWLYTATENALLQDGPEADLEIASPARILRLDRKSGRPVAEYVYQVDPVRDAPLDAGDFRTRGLVELVALDDSRLLTLERAYTQGVGNAIEIFAVSVDEATDVRQWNSLEGRSFRPVIKTRLLQLETFGLELDNIEGMTFGPRLADGRRSLVLVADNNFNPRQRNQIVAFALEEQPITPSRIQGSGHGSPLEGAWVRQVRGTVTAPAARGRGFWMQGPDDHNESTSDAIFVLPSGEAAATPGDVVRVDGLVKETAFPNSLSVTSLVDALFEIVEQAAPVPAPIAIGAGGRALPASHIDDDHLQIFEPAQDTIDFLESLEGMRVEISDATVVGPTTRFGEFAVLADEGNGERMEKDRVRSLARGLVATAADVNPERLLVVARPGADAPLLTVGDRFEGSIRGVLDYAFGTFRILAETLPQTIPRSPTAVGASLAASDDALLVATYNVENLSARSGPDKFQRVGRSISKALASPDIVALQEIQDDTGPEDDGTVSAEQTLGLLVDAIVEAGGAEYEYAVVDPENLADGGQPGANIRVAYLYRRDRVRFVPRGNPEARTAAEWLLDERGPFLSPNPARVDPEHPAFAADVDRNVSGVRKPLAAEFEFNGRRLFLVNVHMRSKRGDSPLFGSTQPPARPTQDLRSGEARVIRDFLDDLLTLDPEAAAIVLGDFNEHPYREPVTILTGSELHNLVERVPENQRYTYVFRGNSQVLDNFLVTESLADEVAVEIVHLNADFPHPVRAADHDPIVVRFELASSPSRDYF